MKNEKDFIKFLSKHYLEKIENNPFLLSQMPYRCQADQLIKVCKQMMKDDDNTPLADFYLNIGFIQGVLAATQVIDMDEEKGFVRVMMKKIEN